MNEAKMLGSFIIASRDGSPGRFMLDFKAPRSNTDKEKLPNFLFEIALILRRGMFELVVPVIAEPAREPLFRSVLVLVIRQCFLL